MMKRNISFSIFYAAALAFVLLLGSQASQAFVTIGVSINVAPPELPVYEQPPVPAPGYLWTPGYWAWSADAGSYYWVPGTWVEAPQPGFLWTPGYWGWNNGLYVWNGGYWGPHIGFYGGVNYGFGYGGVGFEGGYWDHGAFRYNGAYSNVRGNTQITNVYTKTVVNNTTINNVSYNGGTGGVRAQPTTEELAAQHEQHLPPVAAQTQHEQTASHNPAMLASTNHGHPAIAATAKPGEFSGPGVVAAHGAVPVSHTAVAPRPAVTAPPASKVNTAGVPGHETPVAPAAKVERATPPDGAAPPKAPPPKAPPPKVPPPKTPPPHEPREEHGSEQR
jgi:hypothetical protein